MSERNHRGKGGYEYQAAGRPSSSELVTTSSNPLTGFDLFAPLQNQSRIPVAPIDRRITRPAEASPPGTYRLLQGVRVLPTSNFLPQRMLVVQSPFMCLFQKGIDWNAEESPTAYPTTAGTLIIPEVAEDYSGQNKSVWRIYGDRGKDGPGGLIVSTLNRDLIVPQKTTCVEEKVSRRIYDMKAQSTPKPIPVETLQQMEKRQILSPPRLEGRANKTHNAKPRQRKFGFRTTAPTIVGTASPTETNLKPRYKPKAGDSGSIRLGKKEIASLMPQLEISGATNPKGFWKPGEHILDFWNYALNKSELDKKGNPFKPFERIPVVANGCVFIPRYNKILYVDGYPNDTNTHNFQPTDVFERGAIITSHVCAIPIGGNLHELIIFPTNGSKSIGVVVPNRLGEFDHKSNNRCSLPPGTHIFRSQDPLLCQFDPYSPGLTSMSFHLFSPVSRTRKSMGFDHILDPEQACSKYQQHLRDEATHEKAKINESGSLFKLGRR